MFSLPPPPSAAAYGQDNSNRTLGKRKTNTGPQPEAATSAAAAAAANGSVAMDESSSSSAAAAAAKPTPPSLTPSQIPPTGCPLARQPVTTLALVCRFLDAPGLLAAYQTSRQLSAAASHPLTFQHAISIRVDPVAGLQTSGPAASFSRPAAFRAALQSRLVRHFRILRLRSPNPTYSFVRNPTLPLASMMRALHDAPDSLQLHALSLTQQERSQEWMDAFQAGTLTVDAQAERDRKQDNNNNNDMDKDKEEEEKKQATSSSPPVNQRHLFDLAALPCLKHLKALSLTASTATMPSLMHSLPPSIEVLQLQQPERSATTGQLLPDGLAERLTGLTRLRQLIVFDVQCALVANAETLRRPPEHSAPTRLADLRALSRAIEAAPSLDSAAWVLVVDLASVATEMVAAKRAEQESAAAAAAEGAEGGAVAQAPPLPPLSIPKVRSLVCSNFASLGPVAGSTTGASVLGLFPDLRHLSFASFQGLLRPADGVALSHWPHAVASNLLELCITGRGDASSPGDEGLEQALVNSLAAARFSSLRRLVLVGNDRRFKLKRADVDVEPMLRSVPELTSLTLANIHLKSLHSFRFAPGLQTLRGLAWPYKKDDAEVEKLHPRGDLSPCFPALTSLRVAWAEDVTRVDARLLLASIPTLTAVGWRRDAACHPARIMEVWEAGQAAAKEAVAARAAKEAARLQTERHHATKAMHLANLLEGGVSFEAANANWAAVEKQMAMLGATGAVREEDAVRIQHQHMALALSEVRDKREAADRQKRHKQDGDGEASAARLRLSSAWTSRGTGETADDADGDGSDSDGTDEEGDNAHGNRRRTRISVSVQPDDVRAAKMREVMAREDRAEAAWLMQPAVAMAAAAASNSSPAAAAAAASNGFASNVTAMVINAIARNAPTGAFVLPDFEPTFTMGSPIKPQRQ